jgi:hypothetical protein
MALAAVGHHRVVGRLSAGQIFIASHQVGQGVNFMRRIFGRKVSLQPKSNVANNEQLVTSIAAIRDMNT